jgi:hypothetical protein
MADVKVPALLHKMSKAAQKAWYKKNNMTMPSEVEGGGKSAAAAKRITAPAPRKQMTAAPQSIRAMNAARQKAYYEKGGRQPIGAGGSGGSSSMAGVGQSSAKEIIKGIKAGYNPKVALVRYTNEEAEQIDEVTKKEAEAALGGPVKTKPKMPAGKQPEGYRYVRALARRAMKAGLKKEEVEQMDEARRYKIEPKESPVFKNSEANPKMRHFSISVGNKEVGWLEHDKEDDTVRGSLHGKPVNISRHKGDTVADKFKSYINRMKEEVEQGRGRLMNSHVAYLRPKKSAPSDVKDHFEVPVNSDSKKGAHGKFAKIFGSSMAKHYEVVHVKLFVKPTVAEEVEQVDEVLRHRPGSVARLRDDNRKAKEQEAKKKAEFKKKTPIEAAKKENALKHARLLHNLSKKIRDNVEYMGHSSIDRKTRNTILNSTRHLFGEEVEQVDEVDYKKYLKVSREKRPLTMKSVDSALAADKAGDPNPLRKLQNTNAARKFAQKQLTKKFNASQPAKPFPVYEPGRRYVGDSVELDGPTIDEAGYQVVGTTKDKETFRSKVHPKKADALSTHYKMTKSRKYKDIKLVKVQEEVEQMDEARRRMSAAEKLGRAFDQEQQRSALSRQRGLDLLKQKDTEKMQNKLASGKMSPSEVMTKLKKEETEESTMKYIEEKLTAADPASKWISDFVKSDNPKFAGKSKKERIQQALGAYYAKKRGTNEETEQVDEVNRNKTKTDDYGGRYLDSINRDKEIKELERKISKMSPNDGGGRYLAGLKLDKMKAMKEEVEQVDEVNARNSFVATQQALTPRAKDVKASVGTTRRDAAVTNKYARRISKLSGGDYSKQDVKGNLKSLAKEEAEGKVAVTPKEKSLAAHHGDKTKITFGDVLKARLKSAAAKKMGK